MNERIFISYKRDDKDVVFKIKDDIESNVGVKCWIDLDGIESDAQFVNVIINAIDEAEIFLFMYSKKHTEITDFENDWTVREINYAQTKKKRIIFLNIDNTSLSDWFVMMFGLKQQVDVCSDVAMKKLYVDLRKWLSIESDVKKEYNQESRNEVIYKIRVNRSSMLYIDDEEIKLLEANKIAKISLSEGEYWRKVVAVDDANIYDEKELILYGSSKLDNIVLDCGDLDKDIKSNANVVRDDVEKQYKKWKQLFEKKEYAKAMEYLKASADGNDLEALSDLAYQLFRGTIYSKDLKAAELYARRGAELGDDGCQLWLGQILKEIGRAEEALVWLIKSAEQGQGWSQYIVGEMYENGEGTEKNIDKAIYWYRLSAKNHFNAYHKDAELALCRLRVKVYNDGEYMQLVKQSHVFPHRTAKEMYDLEGVYWKFHKEPQKFAALLIAAEKGYPHAQEDLGKILVSQEARELGIYDELKSKEWLAKSVIGYKEYIKDLNNKIQGGDANAMYEMADIYKYGKCGINKDIVCAEKYYKMGAELGHQGSQLWYGQIMRECGRKEEALIWLIKSAEQGQGWAAYLVGEMYEKGEGTLSDLKKAIEWYNKSAITTNFYAKEAKKALKRLGMPIPEQKDDN